MAHAAAPVSSCLELSAAESGDLAWNGNVLTIALWLACENEIAISATQDVSATLVRGLKIQEVALGRR